MPCTACRLGHSGAPRLSSAKRRVPRWQRRLHPAAAHQPESVVTTLLCTAGAEQLPPSAVGEEGTHVRCPAAGAPPPAPTGRAAARVQVGCLLGGSTGRHNPRHQPGEGGDTASSMFAASLNHCRTALLTPPQAGGRAAGPACQHHALTKLSQYVHN